MIVDLFCVEGFAAFVAVASFLLMAALLGVAVYRHRFGIASFLAGDLETRMSRVNRAARDSARTWRVRTKLLGIVKTERREPRRACALEALLMLQDATDNRDPWKGLVLTALRDPSPYIRRIATDWLSRHPCRDSIEVLASHAGGESDRFLRERMLETCRRHIDLTIGRLAEASRFVQAKALVRRFGPSFGGPDEVEQLLAFLSTLEAEQIQQGIAQERRLKQSEARAMVQRGAEAASRGNFNGAAELAERALSLDPANEDALRVLGQIPRLRAVASVEAKARNLAAFAQEVETCRQRAGACLERHDFDRATANLLRIRSLAPNDGWAEAALKQIPVAREEYRVARIYELKSAVQREMAEGKYASARMNAQALEALAPQDPQTRSWIKRIDEALRRQERDRHFQQFVRCVEMRDLPAAEREYALLCFADKGQTLTRKARPQLDALKRLLIEDHLRQAEERLFEGDAQGARAKAYAVLTIQPNHPEALALDGRAEALRQTKRIESLRDATQRLFAEKNLDEAEGKIRALCAEPSGAELAAPLYDSLNLLRQQETAARQRAERQEREREAKSCRSHVETLMARGDFRAATARAAQLTALLPNDPDHRLLHDTCREMETRAERDKALEAFHREVQRCVGRGDFATARSKALEALTLEPGNAEFKDLLGELAYLEAEARAAERREEAEHRRRKAERLIQRAMRLLGKEHYRKCLILLHQAIALDPENEQAEQLLRRVRAAGRTPLDEYGKVKVVDFGQRLAS